MFSCYEHQLVGGYTELVTYLVEMSTCFNSDFKWENMCSIGFRTGLYCGLKSRRTFILSMVSITLLCLWIEALSMSSTTLLP